MTLNPSNGRINLDGMHCCRDVMVGGFSSSLVISSMVKKKFIEIVVYYLKKLLEKIS